MDKDKRKFRRRPIRYTAWVTLGPDELHGCVLSDVSDSGARLEVEDSRKVPDRFVLLLSSKDTTRRNCRVIWREPTQLGVEYEPSLPGAENTTLVPAFDADRKASEKMAAAAKSKAKAKD